MIDFCISSSIRLKLNSYTQEQLSCMRRTCSFMQQYFFRRAVCEINLRFSTAGPRPGTGPCHQLYRAARDSPGIDN